MRIVSAIALALSHSLDDLVMSANTIQRVRAQMRQKTAHTSTQHFKFKNAVIYFDSKIMPDITGKKKVDRMPVVSSQVSLLGVPKIQNGSGENQAQAVHKILQEWNITDNVVAFCADITSTNTGCNKGALILLQQLLG